MKRRTFAMLVMLLGNLAIYLFASAPPLLPETLAGGRRIPIEQALEIVAGEQDLARSLYTREIVGAGQKAGLSFREDWRSRAVEAGPLPALFLRETAASLERDPVPLSLFLGSDFPISAANRFAGRQAEVFQEIRRTREPRFFHAEDIGLHTAMFPDVARVEPCVACHNEHAQSPKKDWQLGDVMGAATFGYPAASVSSDELLEMLAALRRGVRDAYTAYLDEARGFSNPPEIGERWPRDCYCLPSAEAFLVELGKQSSGRSLERLFLAMEGPRHAAP